MKFMGSKRRMLQNGLGALLAETAPSARRFVDLFAGTGAVAIYVAQKVRIPVSAFDLQTFSVVLAKSIIGRSHKIDSDRLWEQWHKKASSLKRIKVPIINDRFTCEHVKEFRDWCESRNKLTVTRAYGGHYFSPIQAVWIDMLRAALPERDPAKTIALAALIQAASQCAAAPGHTAQPFQPTKTAKKYLKQAWSLDVVERTKKVLKEISLQFALVKGEAKVSEAIKEANKLVEGDLVFVDPPYTSVHYSRFYHVLETIALGQCGEVAGVGRYPELQFRPQSRFSIRSECPTAFDELIKKIAEKNASAIVTFPDHRCSNGLSGDIVRDTSKKYFHVEEILVNNKFSTLGGTNRISRTGNLRSARQPTKELILLLNPK
jgi:adenine-specific DNA-methyltransferase